MDEGVGRGSRVGVAFYNRPQLALLPVHNTEAAIRAQMPTGFQIANSV